MINGPNSRMVANRTPHEEAIAKSRTFDVVRWIRARRLQWVGHILRMDPVRPRMVHKALKHISENRTKGDLLMDVPQQLSWEEMRKLTENRDGWRQRVQSLRNGSNVTVTMNDSVSGCKAPRRSARHLPPINTDPAPIASPRVK